MKYTFETMGGVEATKTNLNFAANTTAGLLALGWASGLTALKGTAVFLKNSDNKWIQMGTNNKPIQTFKDTKLAVYKAADKAMEKLVEEFKDSF